MLKARGASTNTRRTEACGSAGFTLVELIIVGSVVFILVGGISMVLAETGRQVWNRTDSRIVSLQGAQRALDRMSEDLREASRSTVVAGANCAADRLGFTIDRDGSGPIAPVAVLYTRAGDGTLSRDQDGAAQVVAARLTGFTPTCGANGLIRLEVTAQYARLDGIVSTDTLSSQVWVQSP